MSERVIADTNSDPLPALFTTGAWNTDESMVSEAKERREGSNDTASPKPRTADEPQFSTTVTEAASPAKTGLRGRRRVADSSDGSVMDGGGCAVVVTAFDATDTPVYATVTTERIVSDAVSAAIQEATTVSDTTLHTPIPLLSHRDPHATCLVCPVDTCVIVTTTDAPDDDTTELPEASRTWNANSSAY